MKMISEIIDINTNVIIYTCEKKINYKVTGRCTRSIFDVHVLAFKLILYDTAVITARDDR